MKKVIFSFFIPFSFYAQSVFQGKLTEMDSTQVIPFAAIGIVNKAIGALSNEQGHFIFESKLVTPNDSIQISAIGYKTRIFSVREFENHMYKTIQLEKLANELDEIIIESKKLKTEILGAKKFTINNCTGFVKGSKNWQGSETASLAGNKEGRHVYIQEFSFYIIQNKYTDSLQFRLMFYEASPKKWPRWRTFLRRPILFKIGIEKGLYTLDLRKYQLNTEHDFFISIECLEEEIDISKFCYSGANAQPAFVRPAAYEWWNKTRGGGAELQVKVAYPAK
ncbi:MAG: carboxypeptidase-like regulatory domain-containing protein [Sphingobacteriaceae bacterium]|nr:carboxypeptidase-like regulatory domain-containing protein [Sphingobacteriaceae bacterium]